MNFWDLLFWNWIFDKRERKPKRGIGCIGWFFIIIGLPMIALILFGALYYTFFPSDPLDILWYFGITH